MFVSVYGSGRDNNNSVASSQQEWSIAAQGRLFCEDYVIHKGLNTGAQLKKLRGLFKTGRRRTDLSTDILTILHTMEVLHPKTFESCSSQLKVTMSSESKLRTTYESLTTRLTGERLTWGTLISAMTLCGTLAGDCVSQGHTEYLPIVVDCFEEYLTNPKVSAFIKQHGGWEGISDHFYKSLSKRKRNNSKLSQPSKALHSLVSELVYASNGLFIVFILILFCFIMSFVVCVHTHSYT